MRGPILKRVFTNSNWWILHSMSLKGNIYLSVRRRNKSHEFIYVADEEPVRKQGNRLLNLLSPQEVLNYFGHVPSFSCPSRKTAMHVCSQTGCINDMNMLFYKWFMFFIGHGFISGSLAHSRGEGHSDEDPAQGVIFSVHSDGRTNLQITKWVQAAHIFSLSHPRHIAEVGTLRTWRRLKINSRCVLKSHEYSLHRTRACPRIHYLWICIYS